MSKTKKTEEQKEILPKEPSPETKGGNEFLKNFPETIFKKAFQFHDNIVKPMFGDVIGNSKVEIAIETLGNFLNKNQDISYHLISVDNQPYTAINHMGTDFEVAPLRLQNIDEGDKGIYLVTEGPKTKNEFNRKCDITKFPLPKKGNPTILVPFNIIVFYDEDDRMKFIANHRNMEIRQVMLDYAYGSIGKGAPGISKQVINISENNYYTAVDKNIITVPRVKIDELYYNLPVNLRSQIKKLEEEKYDVFLIITKISYFNPMILLGNLDDLHQNTQVSFEVRGVSKYERDRMETILIPEANLFVFPNLQVGEKYLEEMNEITEENEDPRIDKYLFYRMYESFEDQQKDKEEKNKEDRKEFNKSLFNLLLIVAAFATGTIAASYSKIEIKKIIKIIKDFLTKKHTHTATQKAAKIVFGAMSKGTIMKILIALGIAVGIGAATYFTYRYFKNKKNKKKQEKESQSESEIRAHLEKEYEEKLKEKEKEIEKKYSDIYDDYLNKKEIDVNILLDQIKPRIFEIFNQEINDCLDRQIFHYIKRGKKCWLGRRIKEIEKQKWGDEYPIRGNRLLRSFWINTEGNKQIIHVDFSSFPEIIPGRQEGDQQIKAIIENNILQ